MQTYHMDMDQDKILQLQALIRDSKSLLENSSDEESKMIQAKLEKMRKLLNLDTQATLEERVTKLERILKQKGLME